MSRSNGPPLPHGAHPPQSGGIPEADPRYYAPSQPGPGPAPQAYAAPQFKPAAFQAQPEATVSQQQSFPQAAQSPFGYSQGQQDPGYGRAPQPTAPPQPPAYQQQPYPAQPPQAYAPAQPGPSGYYAQPEATQPPAPGQLPGGMRGSQYEQWPNQASTADTRGFDFASYQQTPGYAPAQQSAPAGYAGYQPPQAQPQQQQPAWQGQQPYANAQYAPQDQVGTLDPNAGYAPAGQQAAGGEQAYAEDEEYYDDEEQPTWKRQAMQIAGVLGLAITIGLGGWWAYSNYLGGGAASGDVPTQKAEGPYKEKPATRDGKQIEHTGSKLLNRVGEAATAVNADAAADDGSRKVSTLEVNRDGSLKPPAVNADATGETAASPRPAATGIPGLSIVDVGGQGAIAPTPAPAQQVANAAPAAPEKPVIISRVKPAGAAPVEQALAAAPADAAAAAKKIAAAPAAPVAPKAPVAKVEKKVVAAAAPVVDAAAPAAATGPKPTGAGYVAVLASIPATGTSQLDALKQFADLKAKHGDLLSTKTPEVQVANLGTKGTYHRLLVGPPGSQESVKELCNGLKAQGFAGCWPLAY